MSTLFYKDSRALKWMVSFSIAMHLGWQHLKSTAYTPSAGSAIKLSKEDHALHGCLG